MNIKEITKEYLIKNNYDGLICPEVPCGCSVEDLMECGEVHELCQGGYKVPCECDEGCKYHIALKPKEPNNEQE